mgnify:CR=1 FL=1
MASISIKRYFTVTMVAIGASLLGVGACIYGLNNASETASKAHSDRYKSYLLADELRQSSDDLTRLARTYVESGDIKWEQQYFEILDIRNGKRPRPANYQNIYWDFRAANIEPARGTEPAIPLSDLMKSAGFTDAEFQKLKEAQGNSDDLVKTETIAMNMVKGLFDDGAGGFTKKGEPDRNKALAMMHDANYHAYKAKIMKPVSEFLTLLDERTGKAVTDAENARQRWFMLLFMASLAVLILVVAALMHIVKQISGSIHEAIRVSHALADGDLTVKPEVSGPTEVASMLVALGAMRDNLVRIVSNVRSNANGVAVGSTEIAEGNQDLSARTEQQAANLERTSSSTKDLSSTVAQNADNAKHANELAINASRVAVEGGEVVAQVVETMKGIDESSRKISDIISVIDGIAFQTNILALNAAVEAARAGEQGRGFAVVASEVRSLAGRSAEAAKEIKSLINASVERVAHGTQQVDSAGSTMTEVVDSIRRVTDIMGEISEASREQAAGVAQVGAAVSQIDQATQQNAALVEEMAAATTSLKTQANELVLAVDFFKLDGGATAPAVSVPRAAAARAPAARPPVRVAPAPKQIAKPIRPATAPASPAAAPRPAPAPAAPVAPAKASAAADDEWETF